MATYGYGSNQLPFTEETPQNPIDPYGVAKLACEMDIARAAGSGLIVVKLTDLDMFEEQV